MLSIKGIFDWDAIGGYLPFARCIFETNNIPITAYDFEPVMAPSGISVLYAWIFSIGGNQYDESFRLFPIIFILVSILAVYLIGRDFGSKRIAQISVIVFVFLPFHDSILYYSSYYPDLCYGALVLLMFFFIQRGITKQQQNHTYFLLGGITFGLSLLMKLQAAYFAPAILLVFIILIKNRVLRLTLSYFSLISLFFIFAFLVWPDTSFFLLLPLGIQILTLLFIFGVATFTVFLTKNYIKSAQIKQFSIRYVLSKFLIILGVATPIAALWFVRNLIFTGSFIWSIGIDLPDRSWSSAFINSLTSTNVPSNTFFTFLLLLITFPIIIFSLGTFWIIPKFVGFIEQIQTKKTTLLIVLWMVGYWFGYFLSVFHHYESYFLNPRDFFVFGPFIAFIIAIGLISIAEYFTKIYTDSLIIYLLYVFGFFSLSQSMLISDYGPVAIKQFFTAIQFSGFTTTALSEMPRLLLMTGILTAIAMIIPFLLRKGMRLSFRGSIKIKFKKIFVCAIIFSILIVPYLWMTHEFSEGDINEFRKKQLDPLYGGLFTTVASFLNEHGKNGDVILIVENHPLQYFLHKNMTVIVLSKPSNLAMYRDIIESDNSSEVFDSLYESGIRYFIDTKRPSPLTEKLKTTSLLFHVIYDDQYFINNWNYSYWSIFERQEK